jgi:replicative DNA helicase
MNDATLDRGMPANIDAEKFCLGSILLDNLTYDQAAAKISAEDFSLHSHKVIFLRIEELAEAGRPIDFVTLTEQLGQHKEIEAVGGVGYITSLTDGLPRVKNIGQYVRIVEDKAMLRAMIHACSTTIQSCYEQQDTPQRIASYHDETLQQIISGGETEGQHVAEFSEDVVTQIANLRTKGPGLVGFSYGVDDVDSRTTGIRPKEFTIIGGRPKQGKTALALNSIEANCKAGIPEGFSSIEMNKEAILERLYSSVARIPADHLSEPHLLTEEEMVRLWNVKEKIDAWPLYVDDSADVTVSQLCARARLWKRRYNVRKVTVDYMQLISGTGDMRMRMIKASRALRLLAKDQGLAVTALSQLARPNDKNMNRKPEIWDLKESGSLEADANTILLIFRPIAEDGSFTGEDEIGITQRRGAPGIAPVTYTGKFVRFESRWMRGG